MSDPAIIDALMREYVPRSLAGLFDGKPERLSERFIDEKLRGSIADLVVRIPLRGGRHAFVYVIVEHKRMRDRKLLLQVLRYQAALYEWLAKQQPDQLPVVLTLVIHHGDKRFEGPRRFPQLTNVAPSLRRFTLDFEILLLDVTASRVAALAKNRLLRGGLTALKVATVNQEKQLPLVRRSLRDLVAADESTQRTVLGYLGGVTGPQRLAELVKEDPEMGKFEKYIRSVARRDLIKPFRVLLMKSLESRFETIPARYKRSISRAGADRLEAWLAASFTAKSVDAVFKS